MKKLALTLALLLLAGAAQAQSPVIPNTTNTIAIAGNVTSRTRIVTGVANRSIYITAITLVPAATSAVTLSYGTGTDCGTGTGTVTGVMTFTAGQVLSLGTGVGAVIALPAGTDLCITIGTAAAPGVLSYTIL